MDLTHPVARSIDALAASPSNDSFEALIRAFHSYRGRISPEEIARLSVALAQPIGEIGTNLGYCDFASSGGPGSLTTLLSPAYLAAQGARVFAVGVPGRPAGGIDVLCQIPGYRASLSKLEVRSALGNGARYIHAQAGDNLAPLDSQLFQHRKARGAIGLPELAIASILSKKIAAGISVFGLDVRVWSGGNLGVSSAESRANAILLRDSARALGITAIPFLTDISAIPQPYWGRGEALVAIAKVLGGQPGQWLQEHDSLCRFLAQRTMEWVRRSPALSTTEPLSLVKVLQACLSLHGTSLDRLMARASEIEADSNAPLNATHSGFLSIDIGALRESLVACQSDKPSEAIYSDSCGVILKRRPGGFVRAGEILATARLPRDKTSKATYAAIGSCLEVAEAPAVHPNTEEV